MVGFCEHSDETLDSIAVDFLMTGLPTAERRHYTTDLSSQCFV
jgi:hypothetical protein